MPTKLDEITIELDAKRKQLHDIFDEAGPDLDLTKVKAFEGMDGISARTEIKKRNDEMTELGKQRDSLLDLQAISDNVRKTADRLDAPANRVPFAKDSDGLMVKPRLKSVEQMLLESKDYQSFRDRKSGTAVIDIPEAESKTLILVGTLQPQPERRPDIVPMALETATVADLMLEGGSTSPVIEYYVESTVTNNAATVAEAGTKPESALAYTLTSDTVRKIATWIPATEEALFDVPRLMSMIQGRLMFMVKRQEEAQILNGDGIAPNILGVMNRTGVQVQAKGADPVPDAIYKAMILIQSVAFSEPTAVVIHPQDWQGVRLLRTADGIYIWGSPSDVGPERIWGLPIRKTTAQTQHTALVGGFTPWGEVIRREGLTVTISTEHSTYFIENKVAILCEERLGLAVYRPSAFCKVTGI